MLATPVSRLRCEEEVVVAYERSYGLAAGDWIGPRHRSAIGLRQWSIEKSQTSLPTIGDRLSNRIMSSAHNRQASPPPSPPMTPGPVFAKPTWPEKVSAVAALITPIITVLTVLAAFLALKAGSDATNGNLEAARSELQLAERGQITDRFTNAVEQLGREGDSGQLAIRLGGIYALERIMLDL